MKKIEFASFVSENTFSFKIDENELDLRLSNPEMNQIPSWEAYPSKAFDKKDDEGKVIRNKNKREDFNGIVLYIIFMFDKRSSFNSKFLDVEKKRIAAIHEAQLSDSLTSNVLLNDNEEIIAMIVDFLKYQNSKLWTEICVYESLFFEYANLLFKGINESRDKDLVSATNAKAKIREEFSSVRVQLDKLYEKFYNGDKVLEEKATEVVRFSPESVAKKLK